MTWQDVRDFVTLAGAVIGTGLGLWNLWRSNWWNRIGFHYLQTSPWTFVLVNTGRTDILVSDIRFWLTGEHLGSGRGMSADTGVSPGRALLLKAGTAHQIAAIVPEENHRMWGIVHEQGIPHPDGPPFTRLFNVKLQIDWIDMDARDRSNTIIIGQLIRTPVEFLGWYPVTRKAELSAALPTKIKLPVPMRGS